MRGDEARSVRMQLVALEDRRGEFPMDGLLKLRFNGVMIEEAGILLERLTGKLYLDGLHPSSFIYSEGFRVKPSQQIARRQNWESHFQQVFCVSKPMARITRATPAGLS